MFTSETFIYLMKINIAFIVFYLFYLVGIPFSRAVGFAC